MKNEKQISRSKAMGIMAILVILCLSVIYLITSWVMYSFTDWGVEGRRLALQMAFIGSVSISLASMFKSMKSSKNEAKQELKK